MSSYFLGVDGGQSGTVAVIGNAQGKIVGWATAGPSNYAGASEGGAKFLLAMRECLSNAASLAGLNPYGLKFDAACLGMSGGPVDQRTLVGELFESEHLTLTDDARIALSGATGGRPGMIVIGGTGSIAFGENAQGETARAGGWGYLFGDEGGGFDIVRHALRASLREHEGWGMKTALTPALLEVTGTADPNMAMHALYTAEWPRARVAAMAVLVSRIAEAGDLTAIEILQGAARDLAVIAASVRIRLWPADELPILSWVGGTFRSTILLKRFCKELELRGKVSAIAPKHSPAVGALLLAWKAAGIDAAPEPVPGVKT